MEQEKMDEYLENNRRVYDALAGEYQRDIERYKDSDREVLFPFIDYLKNHFSHPLVLELGPGSGLALAYFEREGFNTTAIDISEGILNVAKETSPNTKYFFGDFLGFDFGDSKFDGIFAKAFIHLFPYEKSVLVFRKIFDLLSPEGVAYLTTTVHSHSEEGYFEKSDYERKEKRFRRRWSESDLVAEVSNAGFEVFGRWNSRDETKGKDWINILAVRH